MVVSLQLESLSMKVPTTTVISMAILIFGSLVRTVKDRYYSKAKPENLIGSLPMILLILMMGPTELQEEEGMNVESPPTLGI